MNICNTHVRIYKIIYQLLKDKEVTILHLFLSLLEEGDGIANRLLMGMNIDIDQLYSDFTYRIGNRKYTKTIAINNNKAIDRNLSIITY